MSRVPICISLENENIKKIDSSKGKNEPRSRFIEDIITDYFDNLKNNSGITPSHTKKTTTKESLFLDCFKFNFDINPLENITNRNYKKQTILFVDTSSFKLLFRIT